MSLCPDHQVEKANKYQLHIKYGEQIMFKTWQIKHNNDNTLETVACTGIYPSREEAVEAMNQDPVIEQVNDGECIMHHISEVKTKTHNS